jgi:uncharacterized protein (TIRG00374 family)
LFINNWRFWLGLGVSAALLLILVYQVDLEEVVAALGEANFLYVAPAIALYFLAVYFRAVRWRYLLSPLRAFRVGRLYPVVVIGYMANNLLPARLGELVRSYYLAQREQVSASATLATVVVERVYDGITLLAAAAVAGPVLLLLGEFDGASGLSGATAGVLVGLMVALFLGVLAFLTLLGAAPRFQAFIQWGLGVFPARLRPRARELVRTFVQGLSILNSPRRHLGLFLLSLPVWLFEGAMYVLIMYSFGIDDNFQSLGVLVLVGVLLTATSNLATAVPISVGGIGPFEVVAQQTLVALGVGASLALAYAGFLHLVALWLPVNLAGLALMWKHSLSWRQLTSGQQSAISTQPPPHRGGGEAES